jgi:hypothetical protein
MPVLKTVFSDMKSLATPVECQHWKQMWRWFSSPGGLRRVDWLIFRTYNPRTLLGLKMKAVLPSKRWRGVTCQKSWIFILTSVKTSHIADYVASKCHGRHSASPKYCRICRIKISRDTHPIYRISQICRIKMSRSTAQLWTISDYLGSKYHGTHDTNIEYLRLCRIKMSRNTQHTHRISHIT